MSRQPKRNTTALRHRLMNPKTLSPQEIATIWWRSHLVPAPLDEDHSDNARAVETLLRHKTNGDHPRWIAEDIMAGNKHAAAKLANLARQLEARQKGRGQSYMNDVFKLLPKQSQQKLATLGLTLPERENAFPDDRTPPYWGGKHPAPPSRAVPLPSYRPNTRKDFQPVRSYRPSTPVRYASAVTPGSDSEKTGKYIWHTVGDSRVRSEHAERDGKTFDWQSPPDGGHPGEAPGCRCSAENVEKPKCEEEAAALMAVQAALSTALADHAKLNTEIGKMTQRIWDWQDELNDRIEQLTYASITGALSRAPFPVIKQIGRASSILANQLKAAIELLKSNIERAELELNTMDVQKKDTESKIGKPEEDTRSAKHRYQSCKGENT